MTEPTHLTSSVPSEGTLPEPAPTIDPAQAADLENPPAAAATYCPRCGFPVSFELQRCPRCGHDVDHNPSMVQRYGLMGGMGFIILGGILVFTQPRAYHTFMQDVFEVGIILCVVGAGVCFFTAVADMVRRGGE